MADVTAPAKKLLGLDRSAVVETVLFFLAALAIDFMFLEFDRYRGLNPHPFWIAVLLVSIQYGTAEGLFAAAAATAAYLADALPEPRVDQDLYAWLLSATLLPLLWFVAAVVAGELTGRMRRERDELRAEIQQARKREDVIASAYRRLDKRRENLEARVAGQLRSVFAIYNAAKGIEKMSTEEVVAGVADLVRTVMSPRRFSLYLLTKGELAFATGDGWDEASTERRAFDGQSALFQAVVGSRRTLVVASAPDDAVLAGEGAIAGPLVNLETGEVIGILKIEEMGFLQLNVTTLENFRLLCEWIGTAFAQARRFESMGSGLEGLEAFRE
ncbi:MAG: GAF domain-containing protein [Tagaea sp.]